MRQVQPEATIAFHFFVLYQKEPREITPVRWMNERNVKITILTDALKLCKDQQWKSDQRRRRVYVRVCKRINICCKSVFQIAVLNETYKVKLCIEEGVKWIS